MSIRSDLPTVMQHCQTSPGQRKPIVPAPWPALLALLQFLLWVQPSVGQEMSVARQWNRELLSAITRDLARPPVHARNLFHVSAAMYDAWAAYDPGAEPYLLGRTRGVYSCSYDGVADPSDVDYARREAISFAAYRLITHRFQLAPIAGQIITQQSLDALMTELGYDRLNTSTDYVGGGPAELGNYIAQEYIAFGFTDGSNEGGNFAHLYYTPVNPPIEVELPGNPNIVDPNHWQQISVTNAIDQNGNPVIGTPPPVGHEWGNVLPFAIDPSHTTEQIRDGNTYRIHHDPGTPPFLDTTQASGLESFYKWNFCMVPIWQSHLDPDDDTVWDISPVSLGNIQSYPTTPSEFASFYDLFNGGTSSPGHTMNPITGEPYEPQLVKRGDYTRILAEFWADGPNSETPPGHWFSIMHSVMDHPLFERKWMGEGDLVDELEYDIKAHLALGGAMHDAAATAWSIKGWHDYVRPISAVRYMADKGQSSDPLLPNFHPAGMPLIPGYIEQVQPGDELGGDESEHVGKIKLYTWRGPDHIPDPETSYAGVGWILAENWWPYQRPSFVTPPFSGYISGHSTYSRTAAEVLTLITGSPFFPGGMSNFLAGQHEFLEFESGPSEDIYLQWATYQDASDQCSLSRIWGGIHPPVDDIPGRLVGQIIGPEAVGEANSLFTIDRPLVAAVISSDDVLNNADVGTAFTVTVTFDRPMDTSVLPTITYLVEDPTLGSISLLNEQWANEGTYSLTYTLLANEQRLDNIHMRISGGSSAEGMEQNVHLHARPFVVDTDRPMVLAVLPSALLVNDEVASTGTFDILIQYSEPCDTSFAPTLAFMGADMSASLLPDPLASEWESVTEYRARFLILDGNEEIADIGVMVSGALDTWGNEQEAYESAGLFLLDTRNPELASMTVNNTMLSLLNVGSSALVIVLEFDEPMNTTLTPELTFLGGTPLTSSLIPSLANSFWMDDRTYRKTYGLANANEQFFDLDVVLGNVFDMAGNVPAQTVLPDLFSIDTRRAIVELTSASVAVISEAQVGPGGFHVDVAYSEAMDNNFVPFIQLSAPEPITTSLQYSASQSSWQDPYTYRAMFTVIDEDRELDGIGIGVSFARDLAGNVQLPYSITTLVDIDTRAPEVLLTNSNTYLVTDSYIGPGGFTVVSIFDEVMDMGSEPTLAFNAPLSLDGILIHDPDASGWLNNTTYQWIHEVGAITASIGNIGIQVSGARDVAGNSMANLTIDDYLSIELHVGIAGLEDGGALVLYPNPAPPGTPVGMLIRKPMEQVDLDVFDARGSHLLSTHHARLDAGHHPVDLPGSVPGVYFVRLRTKDQSYTLRWILN